MLILTKRPYSSPAKKRGPWECSSAIFRARQERQRLGELEYNRAALDGDMDKLKFGEAGGPLEKYVAWLAQLQQED